MMVGQTASAILSNSIKHLFEQASQKYARVKKKKKKEILKPRDLILWNTSCFLSNHSAE